MSNSVDKTLDKTLEKTVNDESENKIEAKQIIEEEGIVNKSHLR